MGTTQKQSRSISSKPSSRLRTRSIKQSGTKANHAAQRPQKLEAIGAPLPPFACLIAQSSVAAPLILAGRASVLGPLPFSSSFHFARATYMESPLLASIAMPLTVSCQPGARWFCTPTRVLRIRYWAQKPRLAMASVSNYYSNRTTSCKRSASSEPGNLQEREAANTAHHNGPL